MPTSGAWCTVLDRCLRKDPELRFSDGEAMAEALLSPQVQIDRELPVPLRVFIKQSRGFETPLAWSLLGEIFLFPGLVTAIVAGASLDGILAIALPMAALLAVPLLFLIREARRLLKFWKSRAGKALFKLGGLRLKRVASGVSGVHRPTEVAIGLAADRLFEELPRETRKELKGLPETVKALEDDAQALRRQVAALETIRLGLLHMHAGSGTVESMTMELRAARGLSDDMENLLEGHREVERILRERREPGVLTLVTDDDASSPD